MLLLPSFAFIAGVASTVSAYATFKHSDSNIVPNRWIVELSSTSGFSRRGHGERLTPHARFESHMKRAGLPYSVVTTYNTKYLTGASIEIADASIDEIMAMSSVTAVYPVRLIQRPEPYGNQVNTVSGSSSYPADNFTTHAMTGVDKLHQQGIYGAGVTVAIIDSGIDYTHPVLGGCFGGDCKVVRGYDFVGDNYNGSNTAVPDNDPLVSCAGSGHGTHVAGIVGANANPLGFSGVAPQAKLAAYRVFGCKGTAANDVIIPAMMRAASEGADIISMSLGGPAGWTEDIISVVAQRIVESGVHVSISQGNSGDEGLFYTSGPANGLGVISVSSVDNIVTPAMVALTSAEPNHPIATYAETFNPPHDQAFPIYTPSADNVLGCNPFNANLAGKITVISRGTCSFSVKAQNVLNAGGTIVLIANNAPGALTPSFGDVKITGAVISQGDGARILASLAANPALTISFPSSYFNIPNTATGGLVSTFTSYGPSFDQYFKPSVAAPGGNILSTWPLALGGYSVISGTSMACPFISGVAALMISANGKMSPAALRSIIEATAVPIKSTNNGTALNTVAQQGGGLVDAFAAVHTKTFVTPGEVPLNDTLNAVNKFTVTISNKGKSAATYKLSNVPAQVGLTFGNEGAQPNLDVPLQDGAAKLVFSRNSVTVAPGKTAPVDVLVIRPQGLNPKNVPVFSGFVSIAAGSDVQTVPYLGTAASMYFDFPILDTTDDIFGFKLPTLIDPNGDPIYAANKTAPYTFVNGDAPELLYRLIGGSASVLLDLVPAKGIFYPPVIAGNLTRLSATPYNYRNGHTDADVADGATGALYYNVNLSAKEGNGFYFANGKKVPNGDYKLLVRALKFFGNPWIDLNYESWTSPVFTVKQK